MSVLNEKPDPYYYCQNIKNHESADEIDIEAYIEAHDAWLGKVKDHYRKPVAVLRNWERHFGEVTSDIKNGHDMKELKEKAEKWTHFIEGADKDTVMDLSAWMSDIHKLETAKKHFMNFKSPYAGMCNDCPYPIEIRTLEENCGRCAAGTLNFWISELGGLLGVDSKCPCCGVVTLESPCPFCTNDVGMPSGG